MKFRDYVERLQELLEDRPETGDLETVSAKDDEGNGFEFVIYFPDVGYMNSDRDFISEDQYDEWEIEPSDTNAVCIN